LKLLKAGMDSSQVMARFEPERQALALMDHPTIARFGSLRHSDPWSQCIVLQPITSSG
jgi:hypothetical protein